MRPSLLHAVRSRAPALPAPSLARVQDKLDEAMADPRHWIWEQWDQDRSGFIEQSEVLQKGGLVDFVREVRPRRAHAFCDHRCWRGRRRGAPTRRDGLRTPPPSTSPLCSCARRQVFAASQKPRNGIPDMRMDKDGWYRYWDEDNDGTLDREEVVRALLKTLKLTSDQARVRQMRETIAEIWPIFDTDGSGSIDREEFLR